MISDADGPIVIRWPLDRSGTDERRGVSAVRRYRGIRCWPLVACVHEPGTDGVSAGVNLERLLSSSTKRRRSLTATIHKELKTNRRNSGATLRVEPKDKVCLLYTSDAA